MAIGDIIVGIDIGTSKVSLVVGEVNNFNQIEVICNSYQKCEGIKKGKIVDENSISEAISMIVKEAESETDLKINSAYVTIPGKFVRIIQNSITKDVKDKYEGVSVKDVRDAITSVKDVEVPEGMTIIDIVQDKYILEDGKVVSDPVGSITGEFTLDAQIVLAEKEYVKQILSIFKKAGIELDGLVPIALAERNVMLDNNDLNDNIMLLDIGAGNTEIGVFSGNGFKYTNTIPFGGNSITNDIAVVLNISTEEAEKLKKQYGLAMKSYIENDTEIVLNTSRDEEQGQKVIKSSYLVEIMEARIDEIFTLVNKDIMAQGIKSYINNVVVTGNGIVNINKSDVAAKVILNIPVKISSGRLTNTLRPEFITAYSLVKYIAGKPYLKTVTSNVDTKLNNNIFKTVASRVKEFFYT